MPRRARASPPVSRLSSAPPSSSRPTRARAPSTTSQAATKVTAESVARQMQDRNLGRDSRSAMRMKLYDRHNRVRERALAIITLRGRDAPGVPASAPDGDRLLIRFNYPNDIRGTGFLVWEHPSSDDERFLYLPSLGRVRRIAGSETQESFVGSDFTYEDIGGREFDDYTYAFSGPDGENASWTPPAGGAPRPAWRLESRRKDASADFPRVVSIVLKDSLVVVGADVYNRRNEKQKVYTVRRLEQIEIDLDGDGVRDDQRAREDTHRARGRIHRLQRGLEGVRFQPARAGTTVDLAQGR